MVDPEATVQHVIGEKLISDDTILRCPWLLPINSAPIRGGALVVADGHFIDFGTAQDMLTRYPSFQCQSIPGVIMPPLVNAHAHLELSCFSQIPPPSLDKNFTNWIEALLHQRMVHPKSYDEIVQAFEHELDHQYRQGVGLIGDIGNSYFPELHRRKSSKFPKIIRMLEFLAPNRIAAANADEQLAGLGDEICATAHAPYSTIPEMLVAIKGRSRKLGHVFSIHAAESPDEGEFIRKNSGPFQSFLVKRNSWDGSFNRTGLGIPGTVEYFEKLGILDENTLLVHCVHISAKEISIIADNKATICLCPGSNAYLNVGLAPLMEMIKKGLCPGIGTDSRASNECLDMWMEMQFISQNYPDLPSETVLRMATWGGAAALHQTTNFGSLSKGSDTPVLHLTSKAICGCNNSKELVKVLVSAGRPDIIEWIFAGNQRGKGSGEQANGIG